MGSGTGRQKERGVRLVEAVLQGTKNPAQEQGSAITYARRYSLLLAFGLAAEEDDAASLSRKNTPANRTTQTAGKKIATFGDNLSGVGDKLIGQAGAIAEVTPHQFGGMLPLVEYLNNEDAIGDYENVLTLIDAYNKVVSNDIDNIEDFIDSILVLYGSDISSGQAKLLKETRGLKMNKDEKAEYLIKVLDEVGITAVLKRLRQDIHKFSFTPDMSDENFIGNSSGVALAYKILPFEMLAKTKEAFYEKSAKKRFQLYNLFLSKSENLPIIPLNTFDIVFTRGLPKNDLEISQMIGNLQGKVTNKSLISLLSFVDDANEEDEKINEERAENIRMQQEMFKNAGEFISDEE